MKSTDPDNLAIDPRLAGALGEAIEPYDLSHDQRESMKARIMQRVRAPATKGTNTVRYTEGGWFNVTPLIEKKVVHFDEQTRRETSLWRLQPGATLPTHAHTGIEECTVIEGDVSFGDHLLRKGDFHTATDEAEHPEAYSRSGALLLISVPEADAIHP